MSGTCNRSKAVSSSFKPFRLSSVCRPYLHFSDLQGVLVPSEGKPVDSLCTRARMVSLQIAAIKVGGMTRVVPPTSLKLDRAVFDRAVVVSVYCREVHEIMICKINPCRCKYWH